MPRVEVLDTDSICSLGIVYNINMAKKAKEIPSVQEASKELLREGGYPIRALIAVTISENTLYALREKWLKEKGYKLVGDAPSNDRPGKRIRIWLLTEK